MPLPLPHYPGGWRYHSRLAKIVTGDGETSKCRRVLVTTLAPSPQHHVTATYAWLVRRHADRHTDRAMHQHTPDKQPHTHTHMHTQARIRTLKHTLPEDIATLLRHLDVDDIMG